MIFGSRGAGVLILDLASLSEQRNPIVIIERPATEEQSAVLRWKPFAYWGDPSPENLATRYRVNGGKWSRWSTEHTAAQNELSPDATPFRYKPSVHMVTLIFGRQISFTLPTPLYKHPLVLFPVGSLLFLAILFGITLYSRKRNHDAELRMSEAKFRAIAESTSSAIFIYDAVKIHYSDCNDATTMRDDAILRLCCNADLATGDALASQPTLSRLENSITNSNLY